MYLSANLKDVGEILCEPSFGEATAVYQELGKDYTTAMSLFCCDLFECCREILTRELNGELRLSFTSSLKLSEIILNL